MNTLYQLSKINVSDAEVEAQKLYNVYVIGLPRSGTSMMTRIVELLGVAVRYGTEEPEIKQKRDERYRKRFGAYHPNPGGFYEMGISGVIPPLIDLLSTPYSGCKLIIPLRGIFLELVKEKPCKIIMMWRNPKEIAESQSAFYNSPVTAGTLMSTLVFEKERLAEEKLPHRIIQYADVLANPAKEIAKVASFINSEKDLTEAINWVDPQQQRFKENEIDRLYGSDRTSA